MSCKHGKKNHVKENITNERFRVVPALAVAAAAIVAFTLWQQDCLRRLRLENAGLREQLAEQEVVEQQLAKESPAPIPPQPGPGSANMEELKRLRAEHAELLRLRGQNTVLRSESGLQLQELQALQSQLAAARADTERLRAEAALNHGGRDDLVVQPDLLGDQASLSNYFTIVDSAVQANLPDFIEGLPEGQRFNINTWTDADDATDDPPQGPK